METITSRDNAALKHIARLGRDLSYRREHGLMLCEGGKMLAEALSAGVTPVHAVFAEGQERELPPETRVMSVTGRLMGSLSPLDTPQSVLFTAAMPDTVLKNVKGGIILDRLQDPGNVGSIIRTARAFGIPAVILTEGCADVSNPKTLRAAMGAVFSQRVMRGSAEGVWELVKGGRVYATGMRADAVNIRDAVLKDCFALIGNEGGGLSDYWLDKGLGMLTIPIEFESLGAAAAAAIIMWEMKRC